MNIKKTILEQEEYTMPIPGYLINEVDTKKALAKYQQDIQEAYRVQDRLLPIPDFLPEAIRKIVPGEDVVQQFSTFQGITIRHSRGYVNIVRLLISLEWIEYLEKEQAIFHSNI